jgi:hypothetical protein
MKYAFDRLVAPRVAAITRDGRVPITRDNRGVGAPRC